MKVDNTSTSFSVGLTGGIGSGKSTVAQLFACHGVDVIDADIIAREIVTPGSEALFRIAALFGNEFIQTDGTLNRKALRELIFHNSHARHTLDALLHPLILEQMQKQHQQSETPYVLMVIPLLIESGWYNFVDRIMVVDCPETLQIERVCQRDAVSAEQVQRMINTQIERDKRLLFAHDIIHNTEDKQVLAEQVANLHQQYMTQASA